MAIYTRNSQHNSNRQPYDYRNEEKLEYFSILARKLDAAIKLILIEIDDIKVRLDRLEGR